MAKSSPRTKTKLIDIPAGVNTPVWRNRIVGYEEVSPDSLLANPRNWRIHPESQQRALSGVLGDVGVVAPVIVNRRTSELWPDGQREVETLLDGHLRVTLALRGQQTSIPVSYVDLTPAEEAEVLATLDPIGAMATADAAQLDALLREVNTSDTAIQAMLTELAIQAGVIPPQVNFKEYDESIENEVEYLTCPECGHKWPK